MSHSSVPADASTFEYYSKADPALQGTCPYTVRLFAILILIGLISQHDGASHKVA